MKACNVCRQDLPSDAFYARAASPDGLAYTCRSCVKSAGRAAYIADKARAKEKARAWARANPERRAEIQAACAGRNREKNRHSSREYNKRVRREQPETARLRGRVAAHNRRLKVEAAGKMDPEVARLIAAAAGGRCSYCGAMAPLTLDHLTAVQSGGGGHWDNLIACCKSCNSSKQAKPVADWLYAEHGVDGLVRALSALKVAKKVIHKLKPEAVVGFPIREV